MCATRNKPFVVWRALIGLVAMAMVLLIACVGLDLYDRHLKTQSFDRVGRVFSAWAESNAPNSITELPDTDSLVRSGAIEVLDTIDPRSGQPFMFRRFQDDNPNDCVLAFSPLSCAWHGLPIFSEDRSGLIFYGDGHGEWRGEARYTEILENDAAKRKQASQAPASQGRGD